MTAPITNQTANRLDPQLDAKHVAIIGAGPTGLAAAWDLIRHGDFKVTIYEAGDRVGGLAAGFKDEGWDWPLEKFYHHWFQTDSAILGLIDELGWSDQVLFPRPKTSIWSHNKAHGFNNLVAWLSFPYLPLIPKLRFGFTSLYLRLTNNWKTLEGSTAEQWLTRTMGKSAYNTLWRPLLIGKFGALYQKVTMAWLWARIKFRSVRLGTFNGGFQTFMDRFADRLKDAGVEFKFNAPVTEISKGDDRSLTVAATVNGQPESIVYDGVITATSPTATLKLVPELTGEYADKMRNLRNMGAVVLVLALKQQFMTDDTYWLNLPTDSPDKSKSEFPFLALVEHTNYIPAEHYGGDHIVYIGDYVSPDHEYLSMPEDQLFERFTTPLNRINPNFTRDWVRKWWVFRAGYAQPIPVINHSANIPDTRTPITGLYVANMSQIYPYDRGTNYAVALGRDVAKRVIAEVTKTDRNIGAHLYDVAVQ